MHTKFDIYVFTTNFSVQPMKRWCYLYTSLPHWFLNHHSLFYWYFCPANETVLSIYVLTLLVPQSSFSIIMIFLSSQWNGVIYISPYLIGSSIIIPSFTDIFYLHMSLPHWFLDHHSFFYWYFCPANKIMFFTHIFYFSLFYFSMTEIKLLEIAMKLFYYIYMYVLMTFIKLNIIF
jgi:hypothetical protein